MPLFKYNSVINISTMACSCHIDCEFTHACYIMRGWFDIVCRATVATCNNNRSPWALFVWSILPIVAGAWCTLHLNILYYPTLIMSLTQWGRVTHLCVSNLTTISSDNGLSLGRRQAIIWANAEILLIQTSGHISVILILISIHTFSFMKRHLKMCH